MEEANIYKALGDPVRLQLIMRLADGSKPSIGELSDNLGISRQGARKQLQVLVKANLVKLHSKGRQTIVTLETNKLKLARAFISKIEDDWDRRLERLKLFAESKTAE